MGIHKDVGDVAKTTLENTALSKVGGLLGDKVSGAMKKDVDKALSTSKKEVAVAEKKLRKAENIATNKNTRVKPENSASPSVKQQNLSQKQSHLKTAQTASKVVNSTATKTVTDKASGLGTQSTWDKVKSWWDSL